MLSKNQEEASKKDSTEESQQDIAANEKGIHNLETEEIKTESPPLQHPACTPLRPDGYAHDFLVTSSSILPCFPLHMSTKNIQLLE